jgi:hypothetical protein
MMPSFEPISTTNARAGSSMCRSMTCPAKCSKCSVMRREVDEKKA